jgi:hypothetical protein
MIVDSPLAATFTDIYRNLKPFWDAEATERVRHGPGGLSWMTNVTKSAPAFVRWAVIPPMPASRTWCGLQRALSRSPRKSGSCMGMTVRRNLLNANFILRD